jgi:Domain of unknown function (DUF4159)
LLRLIALFLVLAIGLQSFAIAPQVIEFDSDLDLANFDPQKFTFVRIMYDSVGGNGEAWYYGDRGWIPRWATDHPDGGRNLVWRLNQLTSIEANQGTLLLRLTDPQLFDFPFIFMSDPGWQELSREERVALRRYLENGGFLWVDDFWGQAEWDNLARNTLAESSDEKLPTGHCLPVLHPKRSDL